MRYFRTYPFTGVKTRARPAVVAVQRFDDEKRLPQFCGPVKSVLQCKVPGTSAVRDHPEDDVGTSSVDACRVAGADPAVRYFKTSHFKSKILAQSVLAVRTRRDPWAIFTTDENFCRDEGQQRY